MSNTSRKPTKRDNFNTLLGLNEVASNPQLVEFIEHELALLDKKNSAERKPTPKHVENAGYRADILAYMEQGVQYTAGDLAKSGRAITLSLNPSQGGENLAPSPMRV